MCVRADVLDHLLPLRYAINGRQETLVLGRYGPGGLRLSEARELLVEAKKALAAGRSPARQKATIRARRKEENTLGPWAEEWLEPYMMAESARDMHCSVYERDLKKPYEKLKLNEITEEELRRLCDRIVACGAPATTIQACEVVMLLYRYVRDRGRRYQIRPTIFAKFDCAILAARALSDYRRN